MMPALAVALLLAAPGVASAQRAPQGAPVSDTVVRDPRFGVTARHFGLERRVRMLQWRQTAEGYTRTWADRPLDSSGFAPGHNNPEFRWRSRRWIAAAITVDDRPLDARVISRWGQWRGFRPGFSALPGDLAAVFQPEGDGLGTAENPLAPQIGDLRITWSELVLPPLAGRIELRDGRWQLAASAPAPPTSGGIAAPKEPRARQYAVPLGIGALVLALALWLHRRRHRRGHGVAQRDTG